MRIVLIILFWGAFLFVFVVLPCWLVIKGLRAIDRRAEEKNARRLDAEMQRTTAKRERAFLKACTNCQHGASHYPTRRPQRAPAT